MVPDEELVSQLTAMGFQENGCRRAAVAVSNASAGVLALVLCGKSLPRWYNVFIEARRLDTAVIAAVVNVAFWCCGSRVFG